jgi:hypothetical protein
MSYTTLSTVTMGLGQGVGILASFAGLLAGTPINASPPINPAGANSAYPLSKLIPLPNSPVSTQNLQALNSTVHDVTGRPIQANTLASIDLGDGSVLSFDLNSLNAIASPALSPASALYDDVGESMFTASDCRIMIELPQTPVFNGSSIESRVAKQLVEVNTISISTHRSKGQVRSFGYINPRGFARGSRTIAGTMVLSKTTAEVLYRFLQSGLMADLSKDTYYTKIDQLPPFDFTLLFSNEAGYISTQKLLGVEFVTDGSVISVQDVILEQQITWIASDFTPLTPANFNTIFGVNTTASSATSNSKTVGSILSRGLSIGDS